MNFLTVTFPVFEHIEYYEYLIKISWPALCGLLVIYLFLGLRLLQAIKRLAEKADLRKQLAVMIRLIFTFIVLSIYTEMFSQGYGDWLDQPSVNRGVVESLGKTQGGSQEDYFLTLKDGEESITVRIDRGVYGQLNKDDLVEIDYLPRKKEVFKCTILSQQAKNVI